MKVSADRLHKLRHFVKVNQLEGIKNNDDLQKHLDEVGLRRFLKEHQNAMIAFAQNDYDIDFLCESNEEETLVVGMIQSFFNKPQLMIKG